QVRIAGGCESEGAGKPRSLSGFGEVLLGLRNLPLTPVNPSAKVKRRGGRRVPNAVIAEPQDCLDGLDGGEVVLGVEVRSSYPQPERRDQVRRSLVVETVERTLVEIPRCVTLAPSLCQTRLFNKRVDRRRSGGRRESKHLGLRCSEFVAHLIARGRVRQGRNAPHRACRPRRSRPGSDDTS